MYILLDSSLERLDPSQFRQVGISDQAAVGKALAPRESTGVCPKSSILYGVLHPYEDFRAERNDPGPCPNSRGRAISVQHSLASTNK